MRRLPVFNFQRTAFLTSSSRSIRVRSLTSNIEKCSHGLTRAKFVSCLRTLADSIEKQKDFNVSLNNEIIAVPLGAETSIERKIKDDGTVDLEFQLSWASEPHTFKKAEGLDPNIQLLDF
eukprot:UC4_evm1s935